MQPGAFISIALFGHVPCNCLGFQQPRQTGLHSQAAVLDSANERQRQQRVATQLEKVIVTAHTLDTQHLGPQLRKLRFQLAFGAS